MKQTLHLTILCVALFLLGTGSPAPARAEPLFSASLYPATIDGTQIGGRTVFRFNGVAWECATATYQGKLTAGSNSLTLSPSFGECRWNYPPVNPPQWSQVQVSMNGCDFRLHSLERVAADEYTSLMDLQCPSGQQVVVNLYSGPFAVCKLTVLPQSNKPSNRLIDKTGLGDVEAVGGNVLKYTQDLAGFPVACPVKPGTYEFFVIENSFTLTATSELGKQVGFQVIGE